MVLELLCFKREMVEEGKEEKKDILEEMNIFYAYFISFIHQLFKEPSLRYEK